MLNHLLTCAFVLMRVESYIMTTEGAVDSRPRVQCRARSRASGVREASAWVGEDRSRGSGGPFVRV